MDRDRWMQRTLNGKRLEFIRHLDTVLFAQGFPNLHEHQRERVMKRFISDGSFEANTILFDYITRIDDFPNKFLAFCEHEDCVPQLARIVRHGLMKYDIQYIRPRSSREPDPPVSQEDPGAEHNPELDQMQHELIALFQPKELQRDSSIDENVHGEAVTSFPTGDLENQEQEGSDDNNINDRSSNGDNLQEDSTIAALGAVDGIDPEVKLDVTVNVCDDSKTETEKHIHLDRSNDGSDTFNNLNCPTSIINYEGGKVLDGVQSNNRHVVLKRSHLNNIETDAEILSLRTFDQNSECKRNDCSQLPEASSEKNNQHFMCNADSSRVNSSKVNSSMIESTGSFFLETSDIESILSENGVGRIEDLAEQTIPKEVHKEIPDKPWPKPVFVKSEAGAGATQCQEDLEKNCAASTALQLQKLDFYSNLSDENTVLKSTVIIDSPDDCERDLPLDSDKSDNAYKKSAFKCVDIGRNKTCLNNINSDNLQDTVYDEDLSHCDPHHEEQKHPSATQAGNVQDNLCPLAISQQQEYETSGPVALVESQDQKVPTEICSKTVNELASAELHKSSTVLTSENSFNTKKPTQRSNPEDFHRSINASAGLECPENESFALSNPSEWNDPRLTDYMTSSVEIQYSTTSAVDTSQSIMTDSYDANVDTSDTVVGSCGNNTGASSSTPGDTSKMTLAQTRQRNVANLPVSDNASRAEMSPSNCNVPNTQGLNQGCKKIFNLVNFFLQNVSNFFSVTLICVVLLIIVIGYFLMS